MRTTLDIDDDVLRAAKELARRERRTTGAVLSGLARRGLTAGPASERPTTSVHGFRPFAARGGVVTNADIDKLREEDSY
jgi:hypothetical protein